MNFSSTLRLNDINDYLGPSSICIMPTKIEGKSKNDLETKSKIRISDNGDYEELTENGEVKQLVKAKITLNDCLACSGCITTSETILIAENNAEKLLEYLRENIKKDPKERDFVIAGVSPQSLASLMATCSDPGDDPERKAFAAAYAKYSNSSEVNLARGFQFVSNSLKNLGVSKLIDVSNFRKISLTESYKEFEHKKANAPSELPLLSGICPGIVCYAEKTGSGSKDSIALIPHLSQVRSPQQLGGMVIKKRSQSYQRKIFFFTIMPCFDKKLEASRTQFIQGEEKDVDLVLGTNELLRLIVESHTQVNGLYENSKEDYDDFPLHNMISSISPNNFTECQIGTGSGGYAAHVLIEYVRKNFNIDLIPELELKTPPEHILTREVKNSDFLEILFYPSVERCKKISEYLSTRPLMKRFLLRSAKDLPGDLNPALVVLVVNGFKNLQTMILLLKKWKKLKPDSERPLFDYCELMACPKGCLNGGAQIKDVPFESTKSEYFKMVAVNSTEQNFGLEKELFYTEYKEIKNQEIIPSSSLQW